MPDDELACAPSVLIVGTDAPTLPPRVLVEARGRLASGDCDLVLGPAADGGFYLIGGTGALAGRRDLLSGVAWSTDTVMRQTFARALALGLRTAILPWWYDVDTPGDLELLIAHLTVLPEAVAPETRSVLAAFAAMTVK